MNDRLTLDRVQDYLRAHRFEVEWAAAGIFFVLVALGEISRVGSLGLVAVLAFSALIGLYRRSPLFAVAIAATLVMLSMALWGQLVSNVFSAAPVLLVMFGAVAYGERAVAWAALAIPTIVGILGIAAQFGVFGFGWGWGPAFGDIFAIDALLMLAWALGWLYRSTRDRRAAQTTATVAVARRDELELSVALEQERNRVARDVHDIVAHSLAVVIAQADGARYAAKKDSAGVDEALETIAGTARAALADVRALLGELRHSQEPGPQPGMADFDALIRSFRDSGLEIDWTSYGTATPLGDTAGLAVYRIVQEALTNALRHGGRGRPVDLEFDWTDSAVTITVTNDLRDGEKSTANPAGHGIPGMRERAALAGGDFAGGVGTNDRFRVRVRLPIDRASVPTQPMVIRGGDR